MAPSKAKKRLFVSYRYPKLRVHVEGARFLVFEPRQEIRRLPSGEIVSDSPVYVGVCVVDITDEAALAAIERVVLIDSERPVGALGNPHGCKIVEKFAGDRSVAYRALRRPLQTVTTDGGTRFDSHSPMTDDTAEEIDAVALIGEPAEPAA